MPRYVSHKKVWALQISRVIDGKLRFLDPGYRDIDVEPGLFARYTPVRGDYYIVYPDGYKSISPQKAFEDGYVLETK